MQEYEVHPIEIQYGLFNLSEALQFLHSGVRLMHGDITPEVVVVTGGGTWKLMGFNFSCYSQYQSESTVRRRGREGGREGGETCECGCTSAIHLTTSVVSTDHV